MTSINAAAAARREAARQATGEFGEHAHSAPELNLTSSPWPAELGAPDPNTSKYDFRIDKWGDVDVFEGDRTPWGSAQWVERPAAGIVSVSTVGHGGYKLSKERNAAIPAPYRNRNRFYEEDCESAIVSFYHHDSLRPDLSGAERDQHLAETDERLRNWFPNAWEKVNGRELEPGESRTKDERVWGENNAEHYVVRSVQRIEDDLLLVHARRESTGDDDRFILTPTQVEQARAEVADELGAAYRFRVPEGVTPQPRPEPKPKKPGYTTVPSTDGLTEAATKKVTADLNKRWRLDDGSVMTLREQIESGLISGKKVSVSEAGTREFYLQDGGNGILRVSKATFDAFDAPDLRTPKDHAREKLDIARAKHEKAQRTVDATWRPTQWHYDALREAARAFSAAEKDYLEAAE